MRILITLLATAVCAWAPSLHAQEHAPPPAHEAATTAVGKHAVGQPPLSVMGRAMAALLEQATPARARPAQPEVPPAAVPSAADSHRAGVAAGAPGPASGNTTEQVAVH